MHVQPPLAPVVRRSPSEQAPRLIDAKGGAELYLVSVRTFLRWADSGVVPSGVKIGGRRLWRIADLDAHIQQAGNKT
jgi:predicted DNA-binding transcriptional regulator AlpA